MWFSTPILPPGWHTITVHTDESEPIESPVFIVDPAVSFGIVSDIDDTVMVTALPRPLLAAWNTFVLDEHARRPVPGMAVLLERFDPLASWRPGDLSLDRRLECRPDPHPVPLPPAVPRRRRCCSPTGGQPTTAGSAAAVTTNARAWPASPPNSPDIRWLLVGDDGQHDEDTYGEFADAHPDSVSAVAIRQLSNSEAVLAGGRSSALAGGDTGAAERRKGNTARWVYAHNGAGLAKRLADAGLL